MLDLSSPLQDKEDSDDGVSEQLSRPLVLGGSLDFALQRIGIQLDSYEVPVHKDYREQLADAFQYTHACVHRGQPVLMLLQSSPATSSRRQPSSSSPTEVQPMCWVLTNSSIDKRDRTVMLSVNNTLDDLVHERTSTSMRLPSLHKFYKKSKSSEAAGGVVRVQIPRSVPLVLRAVTGYITPFVGNSSENPLRSVHCDVLPPADSATLAAAAAITKAAAVAAATTCVRATITLPSTQLNKSHTLFLFDDPKHVPTHLGDYFSCTSVQRWEFTLVFEHTWSTTTPVPTTGAAIFKCVETPVDPKILKRIEAAKIRKKAQQYLSVNGKRGGQDQSPGGATRNVRSGNMSSGLIPIRRPVDSRGAGSPKKRTSGKKLQNLSEVETLPEFMMPKVWSQPSSKTALFIHERNQIKRGPAAIRVFVHIGDTEFVINCGAGNQNIKWLALTAGQRYRSARKGRKFKLPGHIVGTEVHTTKVVVHSGTASESNPLMEDTSMFSSSTINVDKWETNVSDAPGNKQNHQNHRNQQKRMMQLRGGTQTAAPTSETKTTAAAADKVPESVLKRQRSQSQPGGRAFTPDKGPEHRAKSNRKAEKKAIGAAEARYKTLKLLSGNKKGASTRGAKRKFMGKLLNKKKNRSLSSKLSKLSQSVSVSEEKKQDGEKKEEGGEEIREIRAASKIQAIQRGRLERRKLVEKDGDEGDVFAAIAEKRREKRKQSIIDSVSKEAKKQVTEKLGGGSSSDSSSSSSSGSGSGSGMQRGKNNSSSHDGRLKMASFGKGLGTKPNPFVPIRDLLSDESHCWIDLVDTTTDAGDNPIVSMWMDKAYYGGKHQRRGATLQSTEATVAARQAAYWATIMAQEKIASANKMLEEMDGTLGRLAPDLLFNVAQLVRKFSPRLDNFFQRYLQLLKIPEDDRIRAKNAMHDLKLALSLVGPNSNDPTPEQKKVEEAFVLTIEAMKVASQLVPEATKGMPSLDLVGMPDFNVLDLLHDSKRLHDLMHKICAIEWSSMDEGEAFGIATQVEELKEEVIDATSAGKRAGMKLMSWAEAAGKAMGTRFGALNRMVSSMLDTEAEERASMSEFEQLWASTSVRTMVEDDDEYMQVTMVARESYLHSKNVFQYFAVIGGGVFDVSFSELMLFLKSSRAYDEDEMRINDVTAAYKTTLIEQDNGSSANSSMKEDDLDLAGWLSVMVRLSMVRYGSLFNGRWGRSCQHFMDMHMVPMGLEVTGDEATMRIALRSPEVIATMKQYAPVLRDVFVEYADDDGELSLEEYVKLVSDAGMIDADLTRLECRRSFVRSQIAASNEMVEEGEADGGVDSGTSDGGDDQSMNLDEFIASIPRLGCDKWDSGADGELPVYIKQERISSAMAFLDPLDAQQRRKKERRQAGMMM